jgi:hypothetical protein
MANSVTPNDWRMIRLMVSRGTYKLTWAPKHDEVLVFTILTKFNFVRDEDRKKYVEQSAIDPVGLHPETCGKRTTRFPC